jgi:DNA (cytosine-5)-methyltransferase 1
MVDQLKQPREVGTSVELFSGAGGLALAMHEAGFRHLLVNESARRACATLLGNAAAARKDEDHVPESLGEAWPLVEGDVRDVQFRYLRDRGVDVVAGGPPCQPFSLGGAHRGTEDRRNMFPELFRVVRDVRPRAVVCENVKGLLRSSFKPYFDYILRELSLPFVTRGEGATWEEHDAELLRREGAGGVRSDERYVVIPMAVNAADYGVPQVRNRVIIVAFRAELGITEEIWRRDFMPEPTHSQAALMRDQLDGAYWERHHVGSATRRAFLESPRAVPRDDGLLPWRTLRDALYGNPDRPDEPSLPTDVVDGEEHPSGRWLHHIGWPGARIYAGHTPNVLDRPAKTVKAGVHGVPGGESVIMLDDRRHRYMTVRETARVMTFPDHWRLHGPRGEQMRQLGNAVPVALGRVFADAVARALAWASSSTIAS